MVRFGQEGGSSAEEQTDSLVVGAPHPFQGTQVRVVGHRHGRDDC